MTVNFEPYHELLVIDLTSTSTVASGGGSDTQTLQPPAGFIYEIYMLDINIPALGGAAGDHKLYIRYNDGSTSVNCAQLVGTNGAVMSIDLQYGFVASTEYPSGVQQQYDIIAKILQASNTNYIDFYYLNSSDTNQTGSRKIRVFVRKYKESA